MQGNLHVRFFEGPGPATAPAYSTALVTQRERLEELRSRLLDAGRRAAYITDPEAGLRQLVDSLRAMAGSAATLETVEALLNRRREAKPPAGALSDGGLRDQQERRHG